MNKTKKLLLEVLIVIGLFFIVGMIINFQNAKNNNDTSHEVISKEEVIIKNEPTNVEELIKEETQLIPTYNKERQTLNLKGNYRSNLGSKKGISMARYVAFKAVKLCEETFPQDVNNYVINFYHDTVDQYGNKGNTMVYSLTLDKKELSKVNWQNMDSEMLSNLGDEYINPIIFK